MPATTKSSSDSFNSLVVGFNKNLLFANMQVYSNAQVNNNSAGQVRLSANQIIFSHEVKIRDIENKIKRIPGHKVL